MGDNLKFLIILIAITVLLFPKSASADIFGILDTVESALEALEEFTGVPMGWWVRIFLLYLLGLFSLLVSASLLNWIIQLPLDPNEWAAFSLGKNSFVTKGWAFSVGLVNMAIVLILLTIAFAYILKIETFAAKKTFVQLIIVALLINFSLVFVKALFDISNILYNYILGVFGKDFIRDSFQTLFMGGRGVALAIAGSILAAAVGLMVPFASPWVQVGILVGWLTAGWFFLPTWFMQLALAFLFSFIFFLLFFLFSARIFIIWILAVLAPWAFLCSILPQTKKYWDQWLKWLLDWLFFGVFILFFLGLGLKSIPDDIKTPGLLWAGFLPIPGWFIYYFFLFIYLLVVIYLLRTKFMPEFADTLISQSSALGKIIATRGLKPIAQVTGRGLAEIATRSAKEEERELERMGRRWEELSLRERIPLMMKTGGIIARPIRWGYRVAGATPEEIMLKRGEEIEKEVEKIRDPGLLLQKAKDRIFVRDYKTAGIIISTGIKKGGPFKAAIEKAITKEQAEIMGLEANTMGLVGHAKRIGRAFINKAVNLEAMGFKLTAEDKTKGYLDIKEKLIAEAKGDEIRDFARGFWTGPALMEAIQKFWDGAQLSRAADEFGKKFVEDYGKITEKLSPEEFIKINPRAMLYLSGNAAQDLGFRSVGGLSREEVRRKIKEARAEIPPVKLPNEVELEPLRRVIREVFPETPPAPPSPPPSPPPRGRPGVGPLPGEEPPTEEPRGRPGLGG